ncbi:SdpA family antimicrobial peptide system protein [Paenarthrobacter sp. NPDC056912]|uniref:SdpA family antimicrobial peptide system protein n=1 Tax=Paenarthrobacter sp. NPDC056912 TaxID=3345965 RepID=UPI003670B9ED
MTKQKTVEGGQASARPPSTAPHVSLLHLLAPAAALLVVGSYSVSASIPSTILALPYSDELKPHLVSAMPQGWAFFSKSPRDPSIAPYRESSEGSYISLSKLPTTRVENLFGVSRDGRAQGVEVALISGGSKPDEWSDCESPAIQECADQVQETPELSVSNTVSSPSVCGDVTLIQTTPVPWSFRKQTTLREKAEKAIKLRVECNAR